MIRCDFKKRLKEACSQTAGFKRAIVPKANVPKNGIPGMEVIAVEIIVQALEIF